jgi:cytochrome c oxidase subunit 4
MSTPSDAQADVHEDLHERRHPQPWEYVKIALILAVLTAAEVAVSYMDVNHALQIAALLGMMVIKFVLVVLWYMHVRFDNPAYGRVFTLGITLAVVVYGVVLLCFGVFQK